jgi:hypothetical protein
MASDYVNIGGGVGATIVLTAAGFLSVGSPAATVGATRLANAMGMYSRNAANSADIPMIQTDASNNLVVGDYTQVNTLTIKGGTTTYLAAAAAAAYVAVQSSSIALVQASVTRFTVTSTEATTAVSVVEGYFAQAMADTPQTISATNGLNNTIETTGNNTAVRALTINIAATNGLRKYIKNSCTTNGITVQFATGTATATIAPGASGFVVVTGGNAKWLGT